jgi:hypothetical protein
MRILIPKNSNITNVDHKTDIIFHFTTHTLAQRFRLLVIDAFLLESEVRIEGVIGAIKCFHNKLVLVVELKYATHISSFRLNSKLGDN